MKRIFAMVLTLSLLLCGCGTKPVEKTIFCMNTVMDLKIWGKDAQKAANELSVELQSLEYQWSVTNEHSVLTALNSGKDIQLSPELAEVIERAEELSQLTSGAFNPKLRVLSEAWGFYNEQHHVPTQEEINAARADPQWDLGGALKGYAGDLAVEVLETLDVDCALLNLGGNIQTYGTKQDGDPWQIGIQDPDAEGYLGVVSVTGTMSVVTSGDYQRNFEENGVTYHHILDPQTGYPADSGLRSVTVICADGLTADALSTALFVMGLEKGSEFWRQSDDFEAVFVLTDGSIWATAGAALSGCEFEVIDR